MKILIPESLQVRGEASGSAGGDRQISAIVEEQLCKAVFLRVIQRKDHAVIQSLIIPYVLLTDGFITLHQSRTEAFPAPVSGLASVKVSPSGKIEDDFLCSGND